MIVHREVLTNFNRIIRIIGRASWKIVDPEVLNFVRAVEEIVLTRRDELRLRYI